jgi:hypothetical protein
MMRRTTVTTNLLSRRTAVTVMIVTTNPTAEIATTMTTHQTVILKAMMTQSHSTRRMQECLVPTMMHKVSLKMTHWTPMLLLQALIRTNPSLNQRHLTPTRVGNCNRELGPITPA